MKLQNQFTKSFYSSGNEAMSMFFLLFLGMVTKISFSVSGIDEAFSSADCASVSSSTSDGTFRKIGYCDNFCRHS